MGEVNSSKYGENFFLQSHLEGVILLVFYTEELQVAVGSIIVLVHQESETVKHASFTACLPYATHAFRGCYYFCLWARIHISIYVRIYIQEIGQMLDLVLSWKGVGVGVALGRLRIIGIKMSIEWAFRVPGGDAAIMSSSGTRRSFPAQSWREYVWEARWIKVWPFLILSFPTLSHRLVFRFQEWNTSCLLLEIWAEDKKAVMIYNPPCRSLLREVRAPHRMRTMWGCRQGITPTKVPQLRSHFRNEGSCSLELMRAQYEGI